ncbi:hypothetical protein FH972_023544 [Carpinus fangiana]|uniref:Uncharacterized protein n=1 Tax=Carpinus fangiana TaxID=176857 RepID=A0A5N6KVZ6_9ROSI|nr:hypothetical protein FH972_023544 [Carpinus fangiana]
MALEVAMERSSISPGFDDEKNLFLSLDTSVQEVLALLLVLAFCSREEMDGKQRSNPSFASQPLYMVIASAPTPKKAKASKDRWPDEDKQNAQPAVVEGRIAASNGPDIVAIWLNNVVNDHEVDWADPHQQPLRNRLAPHASCGRGDLKILGVKYIGQAANNCAKGGVHACKGTDDDLCLYVTDSMAAEPVGNVIIWPDKGIGQIHEIEDEEPKHETGSRHVVIFNVPDEGWNNQESDAGEDSKGDSAGLISRARIWG